MQFEGIGQCRQIREITVRKVALAAGIAAVCAAAPSVGQASIVVYSGGDDAVSSLAQMTNSVAAETSFAAAVSSASTITFETPVPADVTISGGSITNNSGCGALCGFNTTPSGQNFLLLDGGSVTFTFANPINAFGMYITGLQTDLVPQETLTFNDGSSETINTPTSTGGGGAFLGFTDFGASITSVTYNATNDIVSIDDVQYGSASPTTTAIPEPFSLLLLGPGLAGFAMLRRRRASNSAAS